MAWQAWWRDLAVMPLRRNDTPTRKVGRHFVETLGGEMCRVQDIQWNSEQFILFHTVIQQRSQHVTASQYIQRWIGKRLDNCEANRHGMIVSDTLHT